MGWATAYIAILQEGDTVQFRPRGNSMQGKIESGQLCTVEPVDPETLKVGDIVLCKVNGKQYLHQVKAIRASGFRSEIIEAGSTDGSVRTVSTENARRSNAPGE